MLRLLRRAAGPLLILATAGCHGFDRERSRPTAGSYEPQGAVLRPDWDSAGLFAFEEWVLEAFPEGEPRSFSDPDLAVLALALDGFDLRAVRAAVLLARSDDERAARALAERLERRVAGPERDSDAADVVAAGGLGTMTAGAPYAERLALLAVGPEPHPDLEVRVECAATALGFGRREVVPFLLRVLRERTPAADGEPDWTPTTTMAWSQSRAAEALARAAGVPGTFRPDASFADQIEAAARLAEHFGD